MTWLWILLPTSSTSRSFTSTLLMRSSRPWTSIVSRNSCFCAVASDGRLPATKSARRPGSWMLPASVASSSDRVGESSTTRWKKPERALRERAHLDLLVGRHVLAQELDLRPHERAVLRDLPDAEPLDPLHDETQRPVREPEHLVDVREGPDLVEIALDRVVDRGVPLRHDADDLALLHRVVHERDGALPGHRERQDGLREEQRVAQRQDPELGRDVAQVDLVHATRLEVGLALVAHRLLSRGSPRAASR